MRLKSEGRPRRHISISATAFFAIILFAAGFAAAAPSDAAARAQHGMVVAETPEASAAGVEILRNGGNAIDAACAAALATGVTHAASCGIGGGGFMLIYSASTGKFFALDYRECAPLKATATMFLRDGKPDESLAPTARSRSPCPARSPASMRR